MSEITTKTALSQSLMEAGFTPEETAQLVALSRPATRFDAVPSDDSDIPIGGSKLSGLPDLGAGQNWPIRPVYGNVADKLEGLAEQRAQDQPSYLPDHIMPSIIADIEAREAGLRAPFPLFFVAQVNFAEVAETGTDHEDWMPKSGVMSLFFDLIEQPWGFDPHDRAGFRVLWSEGALTRTELPAQLRDYQADAQERHTQMRQAAIEAKDAAQNPGFFGKLLGSAAPDEIWIPEEEAEQLIPPPHRLFAHKHLTLLDLWQIEEQAPALAKKAAPGDKTDVILERWLESGALITHFTQVGGWPSPVQDPQMGMEAQLVSNGLYLGDADAYGSPEAEALKSGAKDWVMLAQIGSDDGVWMWGDAGMLYVWIRKLDLAARDLDKAWVILQSY